MPQTGSPVIHPPSLPYPPSQDGSPLALWANGLISELIQWFANFKSNGVDTRLFASITRQLVNADGFHLIPSAFFVDVVTDVAATYTADALAAIALGGVGQMIVVRCVGPGTIIIPNNAQTKTATFLPDGTPIGDPVLSPGGMLFMTWSADDLKWHEISRSYNF